jgi:hypothetical protein
LGFSHHGIHGASLLGCDVFASKLFVEEVVFKDFSPTQVWTGQDFTIADAASQKDTSITNILELFAFVREYINNSLAQVIFFQFILFNSSNL